MCKYSKYLFIFERKHVECIYKVTFCDFIKKNPKAYDYFLFESRSLISTYFKKIFKQSCKFSKYYSFNIQKIHSVYKHF